MFLKQHRHNACPAECNCCKKEEQCHEYAGGDNTCHRPVPVTGMAEIFCCIDFPDMERQRAEKVRAVRCKQEPTGKCTPPKRHNHDRPEPQRKVCVPDFELELRMLLFPAHPRLIGKIKDRVPEETRNPHDTDKERSGDPDREIDVHKQVEDAKKTRSC